MGLDEIPGASNSEMNQSSQKDGGELMKRAQNMNMGGGGESHNHLRGWHHSSRIIRVSRATGGKDRHSKVMTSKGLRDRRVRLSVTTAIQFYDLQDRLGFDQPSKAVEWLIKAAEDAITELPSLNTPFPETPKQLTDSTRACTSNYEHGFDSNEVDIENQNQNMSFSKSACSSTSETSKNSGLSISRSEVHGNRVKARERARERTAKEKEKETESAITCSHHNVANAASPSPSFTQLLTAGFSNSTLSNNHSNSNDESSPRDSAEENPNRHWNMASMDYFAASHQALSSQIHLASSLPQTMPVPAFSISSENHNHPQSSHQFSIFPDTMIETASHVGGGGDYNLNFSIASGGLSNLNRGTLQSNSPALLNHLQRFPSPVDGTSVPFLFGTPSLQNHQDQYQFPAGFDGRLQLYYGDGSRHPDQKGKGKR